MGRDYRVSMATGMIETGDWAPWPWPKKVVHWILGHFLGFVAYGSSLATYSPRKTRQKVIDEGGDLDKYAFPGRLLMAHLNKTMKHSKWVPIYYESIYQWLARQDFPSSSLGAEALLPKVEAAVKANAERRGLAPEALRRE